MVIRYAEKEGTDKIVRRYASRDEMKMDDHRERQELRTLERLRTLAKPLTGLKNRRAMPDKDGTLVHLQR